MNKKFSKILLKNKKITKLIFVITLLISLTYSSTYQLFHQYDLAQPKGLSDSISYIKMADGDYGVLSHYRYRFIIPKTVSIIKPIVGKVVSSQENQIKLSFYLINFLVIVLSAYLLFCLIESLGLPTYCSVIGASIFLSSRTTIALTSTPLVDSLAVFATIFIIYSTYTKKKNLIIFLLPFIALTKDSSLPLLLIPLFSNTFRSFSYYISLGISFAGVIFSRQIIDSFPSAYNTSSTGFNNYLSNQLSYFQFFTEHLRELFTIKGFHDFQHGFSFFLLMAILGFILNQKKNIVSINTEINILVPLGFFISMWSGNMGRLFFHYAFPTIIVYAVLFIWWIMKLFEKNNYSIKNE